MTDETFKQWSILELMGHRKLAGQVSEVTMFGGALLRIDIYPGEAQEPAATQFYGAQSIYCLTPTTEVMARQFAQERVPEPVARWELPSVASHGTYVDARGGYVGDVDDDDDEPDPADDLDPRFND